MRRVSCLLMTLATLLLLTACGQSVTAKLHTNQSGFNAVVTGKTQAKKIYWQVDDTIHSKTTTDGTFKIEVPYRTKAYRVTLADNQQLTNPTYLDGAKTTPMISWFNFIAKYNPLANQQGIGIFDATPFDGIHTDQVDEQTAIAMNVNNSQIIGISIKALSPSKNVTFNKYLTAFTTSLGTNPTTVAALVEKSLKAPNQLTQMTSQHIIYTVVTSTVQKQTLTQISMSYAK